MITFNPKRNVDELKCIFKTRVSDYQHRLLLAGCCGHAADGSAAATPWYKPLRRYHRHTWALNCPAPLLLHLPHGCWLHLLPGLNLLPQLHSSAVCSANQLVRQPQLLICQRLLHLNCHFLLHLLAWRTAPAHWGSRSDSHCSLCHLHCQ